MKKNPRKSHMSLDEAKKAKGKSNWSKLFGEQKKEKNKIAKGKTDEHA